MGEWQPIESAPRDGAMFIAASFLDNGEPYWLGVLQWADHFGDERELVAVTVEGGLMTSDEETGGYTHWMPLPEPPTPSKERNDGR